MHLMSDLLESGGQGAVKVGVSEVDLEASDDAGLGFVFDGEVAMVVLLLERVADLALLLGAELLINQRRR